MKLPVEVILESGTIEFECPICGGVIDEDNPLNTNIPDKPGNYLYEDQTGFIRWVLPDTPKCPHCYTTIILTMRQTTDEKEPAQVLTNKTIPSVALDESQVCHLRSDVVARNEDMVADFLLESIKTERCASDRAAAVEAYTKFMRYLHDRRNKPTNKPTL